MGPTAISVGSTLGGKGRPALPVVPATPVPATRVVVPAGSTFQMIRRYIIAGIGHEQVPSGIEGEADRETQRRKACCRNEGG